MSNSISMIFSPLYIRCTLYSFLPLMVESFAQVYTAEDYPAVNNHLQRMTTISRVFSLSIISSLFASGFLLLNKSLSYSPNKLTHRIKILLVIGLVFDLAIIFISTGLFKNALMTDALELRRRYPNKEDYDRVLRELEARTELRQKQIIQSLHKKNST